MENRGPEAADLDVLPTLWFRNTLVLDDGHAAPSIVAIGCAGRRVAHRPRRANVRPAVARIVRVRRSCSSRKTKRTPSASSVPPNDTSYVKDGINDYVVHGATERGQSGRCRHQGGGPLPRCRSPAGGHVLMQLRLDRHADARRRSTRLRPTFDGSASRGRRVLRHGHPRRPERRQRSGDAPGVRRPAVVEAVLPLHRSRLARRRSGAARRHPPSASTAATTPGFSCTTPT